MPSRSRTRPKTQYGRVYNGSWSVASRTVTDTCQDVIGDYGNRHTFDSVQFERVEGGLYTEDVSASLKFESVPCAVSFTSAPGFNANSYMAKLLAMSGPLTPRLYLPVSLYELKDLPSMLRHAGDLLHKISRPSGLNPVKEAAAANLAYQFGWKPLIEDIGKLLDFTDVVAKRQRILRGAHSSKGIRRKVTLDRFRNAASSSILVYSSFGRNLRPESTRYFDREVWGTIRWIVKDQSQIGKTPTFVDAFRTAYGLNLGHIPIEIWKALPWSWMIDWFVNISDVLQANYNMIYYKPSGACIMCKDTFTTQNNAIYKGVKVIYTPAYYVMVNRRRFLPSVNNLLTIKLPFLDNFKLSILGSLAVTRLL